MLSNSKRKSGFTILEMLVVIAIFSLVIVVISSILNSIFLSRKIVIAREGLQSDSNSIIEIIAKNIRTSKPYYEYYGTADLTHPVKALALIDRDDNIVVFRKSDLPSECTPPSQEACLLMGLGASPVNWINVNPARINLVDVEFYIEPATDPFVSALPRPNKQPFVTLILKTETEIGKDQTKVSNIIQSSVSSRVYQERDFN